MNDETTGRDPYSDAYGAHDPYAPPSAPPSAPAQPPLSGSDAQPTIAQPTTSDTRAYPTSDPYAGQSAYAPPTTSYPSDPYAAYRAQAEAEGLPAHARSVELRIR